MLGFLKVMEKVKDEYGISSYLIMFFFCYLLEDVVFDMFFVVEFYYEYIIVVGLDSFEFGYLLLKFECVFKKVKVLGFKIVVYVGEEGLVFYIWEVIELLDVDCIDYGVCC